MTRQTAFVTSALATLISLSAFSADNARTPTGSAADPSKSEALQDPLKTLANKRANIALRMTRELVP
ncbi:MAG TPA: hypothetical protein VGV09_02940 [Steroidobacteraceae bacterium]|nr:hypothetical protein [Steroidobacteraceae bacterium]